MIESTSATSSTLPTVPARTSIILALACLAQFMVILDVSVVNVALPAIRHDLHYSATGLQWVVNAYALTFAGFLLLGGRLADLYGRRRIFLLGLGLFTVASMIGGAASNDTMLTLARAGQGLGGAVLAPASLTILMTTFTEGSARHRALGIWSSMAAAGGAMGVVLGGLLTDYASWRWVLFINLPLGIAGAAVALRHLPESQLPEQRQPLDVVGAVTVTAGLATIVYGIVGTATHAWGSAHTITALAIGAVLVAVFLLVQVRFAEAPLMPLRLLRSRARASANLVMLLVGGAFFAMWYFLSLYLQNVLGYSPIRAGLSFIPMTLAIVAGSLGSSRLVSKVGARPPLVAGTLLAAASFLWLGQLTATGSYALHLLPPSFLLALGLGLSMTPLATAATNGVAPREAGLASGLLNTARQVGGALGLAVLATVATNRTLDLAGHASQAAALTSGFTRAFDVGAGLCLAGAIVAMFVPGVRPEPSAEADDAVAMAIAD